jgi:hypothetical protein
MTGTWLTEHRSTIVSMAVSALLDLNSLSNLTFSIGSGKSGSIGTKAALGAEGRAIIFLVGRARSHRDTPRIGRLQSNRPLICARDKSASLSFDSRFSHADKSGFPVLLPPHAMFPLLLSSTVVRFWLTALTR